MRKLRKGFIKQKIKENVGSAAVIVAITAGALLASGPMMDFWESMRSRGDEATETARSGRRDIVEIESAVPPEERPSTYQEARSGPFLMDMVSVVGGYEIKFTNGENEGISVVRASDQAEVASNDSLDEPLVISVPGDEMRISITPREAGEYGVLADVRVERY